MKKAFSLLELIFTISLIAIVASVAIPKLSNSLTKTNLVKFKSDISNIRQGLNEYKNNSILKGEDNILDNLDEDELLFKKVINYTIISSNKSGSWEKVSSTQYKAWIDNDTSVLFTYDKENGSFNCDIKKSDYCKELIE